MSSEVVSLGCPSAVILLMYRPRHWLLRFSVRVTGTCQGGDWRGLWGQSRQKAASWGPMLGFLKNEHTILIEHTQGCQNQELKGRDSFWKTVATFFTIWASPRRRQWHPTPVLLLGKSHGRRRLVGCHLWGHTESDTTEATEQAAAAAAAAEHLLARKDWQLIALNLEV